MPVHIYELLAAGRKRGQEQVKRFLDEIDEMIRRATVPLTEPAKERKPGPNPRRPPRTTPAKKTAAKTFPAKRPATKAKPSAARSQAKTPARRGAAVKPR